MQQLWLVTMPNLRDGPRETLSKVKSAVEGGDLGSIYEFSIPPLSVGTLDSVVALSDDLNKINTQVEVGYIYHMITHVHCKKSLSDGTNTFCHSSPSY